MAVYGYARVSTDGRILAVQDAELMAAGCAKVYSEKVSGARSDRPQLAKLLKALGEGDTVVVTRLDARPQYTRPPQHSWTPSPRLALSSSRWQTLGPIPPRPTAD